MRLSNALYKLYKILRVEITGVVAVGLIIKDGLIALEINAVYRYSINVADIIIDAIVDEIIYNYPFLYLALLIIKTKPTLLGVIIAT